jgi:hypothetical protein
MERGKIGKSGSKRIKQILKLKGVVIRRYRIFSPFPRSIKVFILLNKEDNSCVSPQNSQVRLSRRR